MLKNLLKYELLRLYKAHVIGKSFALLFLFNIIATALLNSNDQVIINSFITITISMLATITGISYHLSKLDETTGYLEQLLTISSAYRIIIAKFVSLLLIIGVIFSILFPLLGILYCYSLQQGVILYLSCLLLLSLSCALITLISIINNYFQSNNLFLHAAILPLLFASLALVGILWRSHDYSLLMVIFCINLVFIPIVLFMATYLLDNLYDW